MTLWSSASCQGVMVLYLISKFGRTGDYRNWKLDKEEELSLKTDIKLKALVGHPESYISNRSLTFPKGHVTVIKTDWSLTSELEPNIIHMQPEVSVRSASHPE